MSWGLKGLTLFLIFIFGIGFVGNITRAIIDNNHEVSQQRAVQTQREEDQSAQIQARIKTEEAESGSLLQKCKASCDHIMGMGGHLPTIEEGMERRLEEDRCNNKCEQDALTRKIEIGKLREMQNQRRQ